MGGSIGMFEFLREDRVLAVVREVEHGAEVENFENNRVINPLAGKSRLSRAELKDFLAWRCFPETRWNKKELLRLGGLSFYDPYQIVQKTHGVMVDDCYWIRFDGENLTWEDVKHLRRV